MNENLNLGAQVRRGVAVSGGVDVLRQIVEIGGSIAMARLLRPEDFGIVAVVMSFLQLSYIVGNLGMAAAVVQAKTLADDAVHAAFTVSASVGLLLTVLAAASAPMAAEFFRIEPLRSAMPVMAIQLFFAGIIAIPMALLRREMRFGTIALVEGTSAICYAATGIGLALSGFGYWSLVWAPVVASAWSLVLVLAISPYRPRVIRPGGALGEMMRFGGGLTLKNVFVFLSRNMDNLVVARMLGEAATGLYTRAFNLTRVPQMRLVGIVYQVSFPAFCRLRDDRRRFDAMFANASRLIALVVTPILLGIGAVAEDFTIAVLGPQWSGMVVPLRLLAVAALVNCLHALAGAAIEATGRVRYEVLTQGAYAAMIIGGTYVGARWGVEGASAAVVVASAVFFSMKTITLHMAVGIPSTRFLATILGPVVSAVIMYASVHGAMAAAAMYPVFADGRHWPRLFAGTAVGVVVYGVALLAFARPHLRVLVDQLHRLRTEYRGRVEASAARSTPRGEP